MASQEVTSPDARRGWIDSGALCAMLLCIDSGALRVILRLNRRITCQLTACTGALRAMLEVESGATLAWRSKHRSRVTVACDDLRVVSGVVGPAGYEP